MSSSEIDFGVTSPEVPPSSTQTSNQQSDGLDFDSDAGGKLAAGDENIGRNPSIPDFDENTDLEEGEIESDTESDKNTTFTSMEEESSGKNSSENTIKEQSPVSHNFDHHRSISSTREIFDSYSEKESGQGKTLISINEVVNRKCPKSLSTNKFSNVNETTRKDNLLVNTAEKFEMNKKMKKRTVDDSICPVLVVSNGQETCDERPVKKVRLDIEQTSPVPEENTVGGKVENLGSPRTQEFEIIDDLGCAEDGGEDIEDDYPGYLSEDDLDDSEIYAWLEEGVDKKSTGGEARDTADGPIQREKIVLKEKGHDPFEVLPEGWVVVTHNSGMPMYLHKQSRVCTLSKPYFLGPGSVRKHDIPVSAVPCLQYRKEIEKEKLEPPKPKQTDQSESPTEGTTGAECSAEVEENGPVVCNGDITTPEQHSIEMKDMTNSDKQNCDVPVTSNTDTHSEDTPVPNTDRIPAVPPVKIEYADERKNSLDPQELQDYCLKLFEFKTITVKKFKTWKDRRRHLNTLKRQSRPALPSNTKLITCSIPPEKGEDKPKRKEFILNPSGKSFVCILHEYAQHTLRIQPRYVFRELENSQNPYSATVVIGEVAYGTGYASSKKAAKMAAAKTTLSILIPEMNKVTEDSKDDAEDLSFFDEIKIEDPRVYDLCNKTGQPSPFQILQECLKRNYGMGDTHCKVEVKALKHQKSEYSLTVGKHTVTVVCKNKREGKQRAAQAILQQLHPHISSLGSLLRLYGRSAWKSVKEKKNEEHLVTELQSQSCSNKPNMAVLEKLREEMIKLQKQKDAIKSKGKLRVDSSSLPGNIASLDL